MNQLTPLERDLAIRTIYGEAGQEPEEGMAAVGHVIRNRVSAGTYGPDMRGVILAPNQFEPWNTDAGRARMKGLNPQSPEYQRIGAIVDRVYGGGEDPTRGATHFFAPAAQRALGRNDPSWATPETHMGTIGGHAFYAPQGARPAGAQGTERAAGRPVTDAALIERLNAAAGQAPAAPAAPVSGRPVTDPDLIRRLDAAAGGSAPAPAPQQPPAQAPAPAVDTAAGEDAPMEERVAGAFADLPVGRPSGTATTRQLRSAASGINTPVSSLTPSQRIGLDFNNNWLAAQQRTHPDPSLYGPSVGSDVRRDQQAPDAPPSDYLVFTDRNGQTQLLDPERYVVLHSHEDGQPRVFVRNPDLAESRFSALARFLTPGLGGPSAIPRVASPSAVRAGQAAVDAADRLGVQIPRVVGSDSVALQQAGNVARNAPAVGAPVVRAYEESVQATGRAAAEVGEALGGQGREAAGHRAREAMRDWHSGPARETPPAPAPAARSVDDAALGARAADEPARPPPPASAVRAAEQGAEVAPAAAARPPGPARSSEIVGRAYDAVDAAITNPGVRTDLDATRAAVARIAGQNTAATLPPGSAVGIVQEAITTPGGLTYEGLKRLRTHVGELIRNPGMRPQGMSQGELQAIYAGLSNDLEVAITAAGGARARQLWERANRVNTLVEQRRAEVARIIGAGGDAPAEAVYDRILRAASDRGGANVNQLAQARRTMSQDEWSEMAGAVVQRMGRNANGDFSPALFLRDYGRLSDAGRVALFGENTAHARALADIRTVSERLQQFSRFDNPSGTARNAGGAAMGGAMMADPITTLAGMFGGNMVARWLARPATASSMARWSNEYARAVRTGSMANLEQATRNLTNTAGVEYDPVVLRQALTVDRQQ